MVGGGKLEAPPVSAILRVLIQVPLGVCGKGQVDGGGPAGDLLWVDGERGAATLDLQHWPGWAGGVGPVPSGASWGLAPPGEAGAHPQALVRRLRPRPLQPVGPGQALATAI